MVIVINIGVLAMQGSVNEHLRMLSRIRGINPCEVRLESDLEMVSGLILPGGESTTIGRLLKDSGLDEKIIKRAHEGMPLWGTCAGMILLAKEIVNENYFHLGLMDIVVRRNAYGGQLNSFISKMKVPQVSNDVIPLVFIRAPWVERVGGNVKVLAKFNGRIIAVQQNNLLATSFHPELTGDLSFHQYFVKIVERYKQDKKAALQLPFCGG
ncbi:MAG: pyridoxal 5'-phosphate synthase glutaminase subunit PdxT [Peptococcaceae bacterium]|jgi:5'-phosphate synthase pdxT subunit|nr:pyridoxal 5'-phosphate synthase glutaminase subunit PdxT [Peptococcaceae bacterium]MDH7524688.1 pyridoxal 5'-phosphate synthase glutaminase subunit PdxT [Peptococcaceae bacterium]